MCWSSHDHVPLRGCVGMKLYLDTAVFDVRSASVIRIQFNSRFKFAVSRLPVVFIEPENHCQRKMTFGGFGRNI